jgi:hypothetical protein
MNQQAPLAQTLRIGDLHPLRVVKHPGREHLHLTDQIARTERGHHRLLPVRREGPRPP